MMSSTFPQDAPPPRGQYRDQRPSASTPSARPPGLRQAQPARRSTMSQIPRTASDENFAVAGNRGCLRPIVFDPLALGDGSESRRPAAVSLHEHAAGLAAARL